MELATAGARCAFDEVRHDVDPNRANSAISEGAHEPSLTAPDVERRARRAGEDGVEDGLVRDESATFDLPLSNRRGPRGGVLPPRVDDLRVAEWIGQRVTSVIPTASPFLLGTTDRYTRRDSSFDTFA